jgi:hypothetical protein
MKAGGFFLRNSIFFNRIYDVFEKKFSFMVLLDCIKHAGKEAVPLEKAE